MNDKEILVLFKELIKDFNIENNDKYLKIIKNFIKNTADMNVSSEMTDYIGNNKQVISSSTKHMKLPNENDLKILHLMPKIEVNFEYSSDFIEEYLINIINFLKKNKKTKSRSLKMLIYGKPGTGKTTFINFISYKTSLPIYEVKASNLISSFIGDTQKNIDNLFEDIIKISSHGIVLIDELDSILGDRKSTINDEYKRMIGSFNIMLDSLPNGTQLFAITNSKSFIDVATIRRFNLELKLDDVELNTFLNLFEKKLIDNNIEIDFNIIKKMTLNKNDKFLNNINYSVIDKIIYSKIFFGKNIYKDFFELINIGSDFNEKELLMSGMNVSEIGKIFGKDRRTIKKQIGDYNE